MNRAGILGVGAYLPERLVTNTDLENVLDTSDEWITTRTGITERHFVGESEGTRTMAVQAARRALANSGIAADSIDLIMVATCTEDPLIPPIARLIQDDLDVPGVPAFDLNAACSGFIYGLAIAKQFIETGIHRTILVVGVERFSSLLNWTDRSTAVLFGDGAGAAIVGSVGNHRGILGFELGGDGAGAKHLYFKDGIQMNGKEVFRFATSIMKDSILRTLQTCGVSLDQVDYFVPHQANLRIIEYGARKLGIPLNKFAKTVATHGNTSAASIPLALEHEVLKGNIKEGDLVVLTAFGAGLTWGTMVLRWGT